MSLGGGESAGARPLGVYELGNESDLNARQWGLQKAWKLEECVYICMSFLIRSLPLEGRFCGHVGPVMPQNCFLSQVLMPNPLIIPQPSPIAHL